jgi:hypothetical protein
MSADEVKGVLVAYRTVMEASWPNLHPAMKARAALWPAASETALQAELREYIREASQPTCKVRVFWKIGPQFAYAGGNAHYATDAGFANIADLIGINDFHEKVPWKAQAAKFRKDDREVFDSGVAKLDILERQDSASGTVWVRVGKAPIRNGSGVVIGILGIYELLDEGLATKMYLDRARRQS